MLLLAVLLPIVAVVPAANPASAQGDLVGSRFPTEESFVDQAYRDILGRGPEQGGLTFWSNQLRNGLPPEELLADFLFSPEFEGTVAPVTRLYRSVFNREPDLDGLRYWVGVYRRGTPLARIASFFLDSAEFDELTNAQTTNEIIEAVYGRSLGREPDAAGLAFWTNAIETGAWTLNGFVVEVSESPENKQRRRSEVLTTLVYLGLQQRTPEPGGLKFWSDRLDAGLRPSEFIRTVMGLPEYLGRFAPAPAGLDTEVIATGLSIPWDLESLPDGTLLTGERSGRLLVIPPGESARAMTADFGDLWVGSETGLLGLAVDPDFATNRRIYTCQGHDSPREIQVIAWTLNASLTNAARVNDPLVAGLPLVTGRHGGCQVEFDRDGNLFVATGDAATGVLPQRLSSLGGKTLRVNAANGQPTAGNPFATSTTAATRLIWTYGHRNIQGLALRPGTNEMWSVEHGSDVDDEVNRLVKPGGNAGWNPVPGYNESVSMTNLSLPNAFSAAWSTGRPTLALSGGDWTNSLGWGAWNNALGVAALKNETIRLLFFNAEGLYLGQRTILAGGFGRLRAVHQANDGSLYVTTSVGGGNDRIIRITPN